MANAIQEKFDSEQTFTITLNATTLASSSGRASTAVTNTNNRKSGIFSVQITTGTAPTAGRVYSVYLLRNVGTIKTDGWSGSDSDFDSPLNAHLLGQIKVTASGSTAFYGIWDTEPLGALGPSFGIAIFNNTDQAAASSGHAAYYRLRYSEIQ